MKRLSLRQPPALLDLFYIFQLSNNVQNQTNFEKQSRTNLEQPRTLKLQDFEKKRENLTSRRLTLRHIKRMIFQVKYSTDSKFNNFKCIHVIFTHSLYKFLCFIVKVEIRLVNTLRNECFPSQHVSIQLSRFC